MFFFSLTNINDFVQRISKLHPCILTIKKHGVVGLGDGKYATRETSRFQEYCYKGGEFVLGSPGWERRVV